MNGWARVPSAVIVKRSELGLTQRELAVKAGVAERTIQNLEAGKRPQPLIRGKIERALGWPSGEMDRIASAPEPQQVDVLADELGQDTADRVRRELARRGEAGKIVLAEMERILRPPASGPSASEPRRAAS